jgi:hypothetical protein
MEVHHPHHPSHKKKWSEYILEFVMLFAAVTLGFFAENIREDFSNREKEKAIIESLKEDLSKDSVQLNYLINEYPTKISAWNDSLHYLIENKPIKGNEGIIMQALNNCTIWEYYSAGEIALSLTQSTESMNLIENKILKKQLLEFQKNEKFYSEYLKFIVNTFQETDTATLSIVNFKTYRNIIGKSSLSNLYMTENNIPKSMSFNTYDLNKFKNHLRNIDHANLKVIDLKTIYSMLLVNEKNILASINEYYPKIKRPL